MGKQHDNVLRNQFRENLIRQVATDGDIPHQHLREEHHRQARVERVDRMLQTARNTQGMETQTDPVVDVTTDEPEFMDIIEREEAEIQATTAQTDQQTQAGAVAADYEAEVRRRQADQEEIIRRQQQAHAESMEKMRMEAHDRSLAEQLQYEVDMSQAKHTIDKLQETAETEKRLRLKERRAGWDKPEIEDPSSPKVIKSEDTSRSKGRPSTKPKPAPGTENTSKPKGRPPQTKWMPKSYTTHTEGGASSSGIQREPPLPPPNEPPPAISSPPPKPPPPKAKAKSKAKANPAQRHSTEFDTNTDRNYWKRQTMGYIRDQLSLRQVYLPTFKPSKKGEKRQRNLKTDYLQAMLNWLENNP